MTSHHLPTSRALFRALGATLAIGSLTLLAACGDDESSSDTTDTTTATTAAAADATTTVAGEAAAPVITGAWARTSPSMATAGAAYATITSPVDDKLLAASVDPSVAGMVQIHETVMAMATDTTMAGSDTTMMGSDTTMAGGAMTMQPVEFIELPAGVAVEMKPGGYHIMMMDLVSPLEIGSTFQLTLTFEKAGDVTIDVPVLDEAP
jgi:hypothetical protein